MLIRDSKLDDYLLPDLEIMEDLSLTDDEEFHHYGAAAREERAELHLIDILC